MNKKVGLVAFVMLFSALTHAKEAPYIDKKMVEREKKENVYVDSKCKSVKNFVLQFDCERREEKNFRKKNPGRGSSEYCQKYYSKLSKAEGKEKVRELYKLGENARKFEGGGSNKRALPGEVWRHELELEANWIIENVLGEKLFRNTFEYN